MEEKVQSNDLGDQSVAETPVEEVQPKSKKSAEDFERRLVELAEENKKFRKSAAEERRKREELEKQKLQDQGQFKELAEVWQRKATEAESISAKKTEAFALKIISESIANEATKLGCLDPDLLLGVLPINQVPIDETFNVDRASVKAMIEDFKKNKPYLFQKAAPKVVDSAPVKAEVNTGPTLSKMTLAEKAALLAQLTKK